MAAANDQILNKYGGLIAGVIGCMIRFASIHLKLIVYGLVLPSVISALVNCIVIRGK